MMARAAQPSASCNPYCSNIRISPEMAKKSGRSRQKPEYCRGAVSAPAGKNEKKARRGPGFFSPRAGWPSDLLHLLQRGLEGSGVGGGQVGVADHHAHADRAG